MAIGKDVMMNGLTFKTKRQEIIHASGSLSNKHLGFKNPSSKILIRSTVAVFFYSSHQSNPLQLSVHLEIKEYNRPLDALERKFPSIGNRHRLGSVHGYRLNCNQNMIYSKYLFKGHKAICASFINRILSMRSIVGASHRSTYDRSIEKTEPV